MSEMSLACYRLEGYFGTNQNCLILVWNVLTFPNVNHCFESTHIVPHPYHR